MPCMEMRKSHDLLRRLVALGLVILIAVGLWQGYGPWLLGQVRAHVL